MTDDVELCAPCGCDRHIMHDHCKAECACGGTPDERITVPEDQP